MEDEYRDWKFKVGERERERERERDGERRKCILKGQQ